MEFRDIPGLDLSFPAAKLLGYKVGSAPPLPVPSPPPCHFDISQRSFRCFLQNKLDPYMTWPHQQSHTERVKTMYFSEWVSFSKGYPVSKEESYSFMQGGLRLAFSGDH